MPRLFASMMRFSIWSEMPSPWRPPMRLASRASSTRLANVWPLRATGKPSSKRTVTSSGRISTAGSQCFTDMMGCTMRRPLFRNSSSFASCVAPQMLESVE